MNFGRKNIKNEKINYLAVYDIRQNKYSLILPTCAKMKSAMKHLFSTVKAQIVLLTAVFSLFCTILSASISFAFLQSYVRQNLSQAATFNLQLISGLCAKDVSLINTLARWCSANHQITQWCKNPGNAKTQGEAWERLKEEFQNNTANQYIRRIILCNKDMSDIIQVGTKLTESRPLTTFLLNDFTTQESLNPEKSWKTIFTDYFSFEKNENSIPVVMPLYDTSSAQRIGTVYIFVDSGFITDRFENYAPDYTSLPEVQIGNKNFIIQNGTLVPVEKNEKQRFQVTIEIPNTQIIFTQNLQKALFRKNNELFIKILLLLALGTAFLAAILKSLLTKMITVPLSKINMQLTKVSGGNFEANHEIEWNNEIGDVGRGINSLSENIKTLMEHKVNDEKNKRLLEYKMLQNQINPHFLYNTLNAIKWMATIQHADGIAEMITSLARLLKNVSKASHLIPLSHELELLDDYFVILKYRYGGAICMTKEIPDEVMNNIIPSFTLQPLLENAIFHGIEPTGQEGKISLKGQITEGAVKGDPPKMQLVLTDNGRGMDEETIRKIFTETEDTAGIYSGMFRKVGLLNVHKRIQYEFGSKYGLTILSEPGKYTSITIELPLKNSEEDGK